jgi:hypothetical protein
MGSGRSFVVRVAVVSLLCFSLLSCAGPENIESAAGRAVYGGQGIKGALTFQGEPLKDAYVYAYRKFSTNLLGPADFASSPSAADGTYTIDLVGGSYYIVARKRATGENTGPLMAGDLYTVHSSNPVAVRDGQYALVDLELVKMRDPMFFQAMSREETNTGIKGVIVDAEGRPIPWVFAMAYTTPDMKRVPEYTSVMTNADGKFVIFLPKGGKYWLAARKNIREKPVTGEPYGLYEGTKDHSIMVPDTGFVENVAITLEAYRKGIQDENAPNYSRTALLRAATAGDPAALSALQSSTYLQYACGFYHGEHDYLADI